MPRFQGLRKNSAGTGGLSPMGRPIPGGAHASYTPGSRACSPEPTVFRQHRSVDDSETILER